MGDNNYFFPTGADTNAKVQEKWDQLTNKSKPTPQVVEVA
jgi:hypothetical protein